MQTLYDRLRSAWDTGLPLSLDRVAEQLADEGVAEAAIVDELMRLLLEVRAAGANEETEERISGVIDRLTGWCHESNHIKTKRTDLPTEEEIAKLPHWARVAFAARCARRVLPLINRVWPEELEPSVERDVNLAELAAANATRLTQGPAINTVGFAAAAHFSDIPVAHLAARAAQRAARAAEAYLDYDPTPVVVETVLEAAEAAAEAARAELIGIDIRPMIRRDLEHLGKLAESQRWTDETPVPPSVFGSLWPNGLPAGWPAREPVAGSQVPSVEWRTDQMPASRNS